MAHFFHQIHFSKSTYAPKVYHFRTYRRFVHMKQMKMNKKNGQKKLLAAFAIMAMVVCAFVVAAPIVDAAGEGEGEATPVYVASYDGTDYETLEAAIDAAIGDTAGYETITILKDTTLKTSKTLANTTIDINGKVLTIDANVTLTTSYDFNADSQKLFTLDDSGSKIIINGSIVATAKNAEVSTHFENNSDAGNGIFLNKSGNVYDSTVIINEGGSLTIAEEMGVVGSANASKLILEVAGTFSHTGNGWQETYLKLTSGTASFNFNDGSLTTYADISGNGTTLNISGENKTGTEKEIARFYAMNMTDGSILNVNGKVMTYASTSFEDKMPAALEGTFELGKVSVGKSAVINVNNGGSFVVKADTCSSLVDIDGTMNIKEGGELEISKKMDETILVDEEGAIYFYKGAKMSVTGIGYLIGGADYGYVLNSVQDESKPVMKIFNGVPEVRGADIVIYSGVGITVKEKAGEEDVALWVGGFIGPGYTMTIEAGAEVVIAQTIQLAGTIDAKGSLKIADGGSIYGGGKVISASKEISFPGEIKGEKIVGAFVVNDNDAQTAAYVSFVNGEIIIPKGVQVDGKVAFGENGANFTDLEAGVGGITLKQGSIVISGTIATGATIEITGGEANLNDIIAAGLTVEGTGDIVLGNIEIPAGSSLVIDANVVIEGTIDVAAAGSLTISTGKTVGITEGGSIAASQGTVSLNGELIVTSGGEAILPSITGSSSGLKVLEGAEVTVDNVVQVATEKLVIEDSDGTTVTVKALIDKYFGIGATEIIFDNTDDPSASGGAWSLTQIYGADFVVPAGVSLVFKQALTINQIVTLGDGASITAPSISATAEVNGFTISGLGQATIIGVEETTPTVIEGIEIESNAVGSTNGTATFVGGANKIISFTAGTKVINASISLTKGATSSEIVMKNVAAGTDGISMVPGSIEITGNVILNGVNGESPEIYEISGSDQVKFGDVEITGEGIISLKEFIITGYVTIGKDIIVNVGAGQTLTIETGATLTGEGKVVLNAGSIVVDGLLDVDVETDDTVPFTVCNEAEFVTGVTYYDNIILGDNIALTKNINVEGKKINLNGKAITVNEGVTLAFLNTQVEGATQGIFTYGTVTISSSDIYTQITAPKNIGGKITGKVDVIAPKVMKVDGSTVGDLGKVGYGNVLEINGDFTISKNNTVEIFGTIGINGSLVAAEKSVINVHPSGTIDVAEGATFVMGGTIELDGKMVVNGTVDLTGKLDSVGEALVNGTMNITGELVGAVIDAGTVTFDAKAGAGAEIKLRDGATITIADVEGALIVSDRGAADAMKGTSTVGSIIEGNSVKLEDVGGVTVSLTVANTGAGDKKAYTTNMTVSGETILNTDATEGTITITVAGYGLETGEKDIIERVSTITVADDLKVIKDIELVFAVFDNSGFYSGTATVVSEAATGIIAITGNIDATAAKKVETTALLAVEGSVTVGPDAGSAIIVGTGGFISAAYYKVTATVDNVKKDTGYYMTIDAALPSIATAKDKTIEVMGVQTLTATSALKSGEVLKVLTGSELVIDDECDLTIESGAKIQNAGTIDVDGLLKFNDYSTGYPSAVAIDADVMIIENPARTYMSLARAIDAGMTDITLNQDIVIEGDVIIPAGTVVESDKYKITVDEDSSLTVEGGVALTGNGMGIILTPGVPANNTDDGELILAPAGYVYQKADPNDATNPASLLTPAVDAAYYEGTYENVDVYAVTGIEYAANDCHDGEIMIVGNLKAGDIEFTADEDASVIITIDNRVYRTGADEGKVAENSSLTVSSITLGDNVAIGSFDVIISLVPYYTAGTFTGTVITENTTMDLQRVKNFAITVATEIDLDEDGVNETYTGIAGMFEGNTTVVDGSVLVGDLGLNKDTEFIVAEGAVMDILDIAGVGLTVNELGLANNKVILTIAGTLDIRKDQSLDNIVITGTLNIIDCVVNVTAVTLEGTINVIDDEKDVALLKVNTLSVGKKTTTLGGTASIVGDVEIVGANNYLKAYPGADLSQAYIEWDSVNAQSLAISTEFLVNGELYMTVIVKDDTSTVKVIDIIETEIWEIAGIQNGLFYAAGSTYNDGLYDIDSWYYDVSMADNKKANGLTEVADYEAFYAEADPALIEGTVSIGTGLNLFIDGIRNYGGVIDLGVGKHVLTFDVSTGYDGSKATMSFNGVVIESGATIEITPDMKEFSIIVTGAVPAEGTVVIPSDEAKEGMTLVEILLIVLVVLILIMAIIVAMRLMRS